MSKFNEGDLVQVTDLFVGATAYKGQLVSQYLSGQQVVLDVEKNKCFCTGGYWVDNDNMTLLKKGHKAGKYTMKRSVETLESRYD